MSRILTQPEYGWILIIQYNAMHKILGYARISLSDQAFNSGKFVLTFYYLWRKSFQKVSTDTEL